MMCRRREGQRVEEPEGGCPACKLMQWDHWEEGSKRPEHWQVNGLGTSLGCLFNSLAFTRLGHVPGNRAGPGMGSYHATGSGVWIAVCG